MKHRIILAVLLLATVTTIGSSGDKASAVERGDKVLRDEYMRWAAAQREKRAKEKKVREQIDSLSKDLVSLARVDGIWVRGPHLQRNDESAGLTADQVKRDVEAELRLEGIKINTPEECVASADEATLLVKIDTNHEKDGQHIGYYVSLVFDQEVILVRKPHARVDASTWHTGVLGRSNKNEFAQAVRRDIRYCAALFAHNYAIARVKK